MNRSHLFEENHQNFHGIACIQNWFQMNGIELDLNISENDIPDSERSQDKGAQVGTYEVCPGEMGQFG